MVMSGGALIPSLRSGKEEFNVTYFDYDRAPHAIRPDLAAAHRTYWEVLRRPGSWWSGAERVALAAASRRARDCAFCLERKQALSPYGMQGLHDHDGVLEERVVDAVHRIVTDQGRITQQWVNDNAGHGLSREAYVELVGVVVAVLSIDEFHRALGMELEALPAPKAGKADGYRPQILSDDIGFVPTVPPEGAVGVEEGLWPEGQSANVIRALTLVPQAMKDWVALADAQYLSIAGMANFFQDDARSINRMQMELVAGRVSAANQCFY